jgi:hypothetical protein
MVETGRGNCFTHTEAATLMLLGQSAILTAGVRLVLAPRRTNFHTESIIFGRSEPEVAVLDLIRGEPEYPDFDENYGLIRKIFLLGDKWVFAYYQDNEGHVETAVKSAGEGFGWPEGSSAHAVYMPAVSGIVAMQGIAKLHGMRRTVLNNEQGFTIPTLPVN